MVVPIMDSTWHQETSLGLVEDDAWLQKRRCLRTLTALMLNLCGGENGYRLKLLLVTVVQGVKCTQPYNFLITINRPSLIEVTGN